jgi:hypothetical protein
VSRLCYCIRQAGNIRCYLQQKVLPEFRIFKEPHGAYLITDIQNINEFSRRR